MVCCVPDGVFRAPIKHPSFPLHQNVLRTCFVVGRNSCNCIEPLSHIVSLLALFVCSIQKLVETTPGSHGGQSDIDSVWALGPNVVPEDSPDLMSKRCGVRSNDSHWSVVAAAMLVEEILPLLRHHEGGFGTLLNLLPAQHELMK